MDFGQAVKKIRAFYFKERRIPTYREVATLFNYKSPAPAQYLISKLIEFGVLDKDEKGNLIPKTLLNIPHLGTIKAGYPMTAFPTHDDSIDVFRYLQDATGDVYFLTVSGDSMIEAHIDDGDKVIIDPNRTVKNGDIVAAIVDNDWTIKYYHNIEGRIELRPANKKYPIIYPQESLVIGGVLRAVIRKYV